MVMTIPPANYLNADIERLKILSLIYFAILTTKIMLRTKRAHLKTVKMTLPMQSHKQHPISNGASDSAKRRLVIKVDLVESSLSVGRDTYRALHRRFFCPIQMHILCVCSRLIHLQRARQIDDIFFLTKDNFFQTHILQSLSQSLNKCNDLYQGQSLNFNICIGIHYIQRLESQLNFWV